ncbi:MAG TPA: alpha/beta hydrolase [Longimicrobiales bacterium]|nr:alpha/beta hydrolase [Longimicrobiales bacterium]
MHIYCTGSGAPTVVLQAGATGFAQTWAWVQAWLSESTRVCSYDRAGLGWSEEPPASAHDAVSIARDMRTLLADAGERGPFILIGHSLGGSLIQAYAGLYPDDVVALGMVDPSHPDQLDRFGPDIRRQQERFQSMIRVASGLAHVGVVRALNPLGRFASGLPEDDYRAARMFASSPRHLRNSHAEMSQWDSTMAAARRVSSLGDRPLLVLSAGQNMEGMPEGFLDLNYEMHAELAALSGRGKHVRVEDADHYSILMDSAHAAATSALLLELIDEARQSPIR